ncbi:hypothetical protein LXL04_037864 [Taraxacum kok-saghyz]
MANNINYKVKFMCSYGGKIHPRPHDNQLAYIGSETKILSVDRSIKFTALIAKLAALCDADVCFKYQLSVKDLDALISVTNDDDLDQMMIEYDRLNRASPKPARLRLFGSEKGVATAPVLVPKVRDIPIAEPPIRHHEPDVAILDDRGIGADRIQKHIQDLRRLRIAEEQQ